MDEQQFAADEEQPEVSEMASEEPIMSDEAGNPATEENEDIPAPHDSGEPSSASKMAMDEFIRASSEQLEGCEFSLLIVLQPDNVRHRVTVTAETTLGNLRKILCTDLQLNPELVSFPDLHGLRDADQNEENLPLSVYGLPGGNSECTLEAYVARPPTTSNYVMPDRIRVQVYNVQEFDCALTRELVELIDREADMLSRGRKEKSLEGLRKRLTNLFLQFIETPEFNPEAAALKHSRA
ncbi:hypothetical protein AM588_10002334 [Phytophthora nicotianae]|uniref:IQ motif and ubiquitin-like domain-containing protein n=1 Tax=Phytophthora nicotianae TaxID=4792 RepID=A0A0W8CS78_PHYNI|nr:hypothetical protein AM588_10002334 [Phytophthora nicotianae]